MTGDQAARDERCGYAVVDLDGEQAPCDRPTVGWRWYQDVGEHEDLLDRACIIHENPGGNRMAELTADLAAAQARAEAAEARLAAVEAVHWIYFDEDGEPGVDDTTPEPEDVWRYDRDYRAALTAHPEATPPASERSGLGGGG